MPSIRHLLPPESTDLAEHLLRLDLDDRRMRFQGMVGDASVRTRVARMDWFRTHVLVHHEDGVLRAAAELALDRPWRPREAELAITVERSLQGQGVGTELTRRAVDLARSLGVERIVMTCLTENARMRRIALGLASDLRVEQGEVTSTLRLAPPTPLTVWTAAFQEWMGWTRAVIERSAVGWRG